MLSAVECWPRRSTLLGFHLLPLILSHLPAEGSELSGALHAFAAVHGHHFPIDIARAVAHQESGQVGKLLGRTEPAERNPLLGGGFEVRPWQQTGESPL